jgi:hypothetical protein
VVDAAAVATGRTDQVDPATRERARAAAEQAAERGAQAAWALVGAIVLSLLLGMIGGAIGTRAAGRRVDGAKRAARRTVVPAGDPNVRTERVVVR